MSVVNCKVKYIRPEYDNLKIWMEDSNNVYVGRAGVVFIEKERFQKDHLFLQIHLKLGKMEIEKRY